MTRNESKALITKLLEKYYRYVNNGRAKVLNEAQTRNEFIDPLFEALGWDMRNTDNDGEVTFEETISKDRVDYAFRISGIPKMFLEAKSIRTDLDIEAHARQAINYSWNKGVTWAILTDFESLKVFNSQAKSNYLTDKLVFEIRAESYIEDFDRLWLLSKEAFISNELDKYAEKYGKKVKRVTVNEKLFSDLKDCREILTKELGIWNDSVDKELLDEGVQKILDRLIFIRVLEDRGLEPPILIAIKNEWQKSDRKKTLFQMLVEKFRELDETYDSSLFKEHACEKWEDIEGSIAKVIDRLYEHGSFVYDFKEMPIDILGGVYESYLGYISQNPINIGQKKGKLFELDEKNSIKTESRKKRKDQGIYYTPKHIVDFIVKNTLGEVLKDVNSVSDLKKIKILDPACGSGSFLTEALEEVNNRYRELGNPGDQFTKSEILLSNIYGVDLDSQAVELARLNLLIGALEKKAKLPNLTRNIREGNSLISGEAEELRKYFGRDWMNKKPLNWKDEFVEVMSTGGFDVIIGNPPWVTLLQGEIGESELKYYKDNYIVAEGFKLNLFPMFIEMSLKLLKPDGVLSFIVPNRLLDTPSYKSLMKEIISQYRISFIVDIPKGSFEGVVAGNIIIAIKRAAPEKQVVIYRNCFHGNEGQKTLIDVEKVINNDYVINLNHDGEATDILEKISKVSSLLSEYANIHVGIMVKDKNNVFSAEPSGDKYGIVVGRDFEKYFISSKRYFNPDKVVIFGGTKNRTKQLTMPKIFVRKTGNSIVACLDTEGVFAEQSTYLVLPKNINSKYLLGLLNSNLLTFYFRKKLITNPESYPYIQHYDLEKLPIAAVSKAQEKTLVGLVDRIMSLKTELARLTDNSNRFESIEAEIVKVSNKINQEVYSLYGVTSEEISTIENCIIPAADSK